MTTGPTGYIHTSFATWRRSLERISSWRVGADGPTTFTLRLSGEWDIANEPTLRLEVSRYHKSTATNLDIDLACVTFLDASCLDDLARLVTISSQRKGTVTLREPTNQIRRLLELVGFDQCCSIVDAAEAQSVRDHAEPRTDGTSQSGRLGSRRESLTADLLIPNMSRSLIH
jgi:anti-anti-sigma factor